MDGASADDEMTAFGDESGYRTSAGARNSRIWYVSQEKWERREVITLEEVAGLIRREVRVMVPDSLSIDENTRLDDLGLSSLQIAEIVFTLEENHDVEFDPARAADARTLGDLVALGNETVRTQAD